MRRIITILLASLLLLTTACVDETEYADNPRGNFEALWRAIDEHYCFFDYKHEQYGLDWDEVHERYSRQIADDMTTGQLFEVLGNMLGELRDGHVNMYSAWDVARNWSWHEDYPSNVSDTLLSKYLGTDYRIAAGLRYRVLDDNTGYIRCATFAYNFGEGNLDNIMLYLAPCNGLIIDLRDNGGGQLTAAEQLAARFTNERLLVGYMQHKTGKAHTAFSEMKSQYLKPSKGIRCPYFISVVSLLHHANHGLHIVNYWLQYVKHSACCRTIGCERIEIEHHCHTVSCYHTAYFAVYGL